MKNIFYLYPTLKDYHMADAKISYSNLSFFYHDTRRKELTGEIKKREINYESKDQGNIELNDISGAWDVSFDDLMIYQNLQINDPSVLFGREGIVSKGATIGVSVLWYSKESLQRGARQLGSFRHDTESFHVEVESLFDKSDLTGKLDYSLVLYVKDIDDVEEQHIFANEHGLILGTIFNSTIILEGEESSFPIVSIESKDKPLWSLYYSWATLEDDFKDSITLRLNKSHSDYKLLNMEEPRSYNDQLFKQILVVVVSMILEQARSNNEIVTALEGDGYVGSMGYLIKYYIETYEVNYESNATILESVMKGVWGHG